MKNRSTILLVPVAASTLLLGACGGNSSSSSSAAATTAVASTAATSGAMASSGTAATTAAGASAAATTSSQCPTSNTRSFAKTRFVADVGLAAGTFHRYLYKPYQAGTFTKGANGRNTAIAKAAVAAALDAKLVDHAYKNVQASPALCKALVEPLGQLKGAMGGLKGDVTSGNLGAIATIEGLVKKVESGSAANGAPIAENDSVAAAQSAAAQG